MIKPLFYEKGKVFIIDQTRLPAEFIKYEIQTEEEMADAIRKLAIRGAPALGIAGAYGLCLGLKPYVNEPKHDFYNQLKQVSDRLITTRPTAVNLSWGIRRLIQKAEEHSNLDNRVVLGMLFEEATSIHREDIQMCQSMGKLGAALLPKDCNVITHCNAGGLATGGLGTALGIVITAHKEGKNIHAFVDETRPLLQGARLTAWELGQENVPHTVITDNMAAHVMQRNKIDAIIVGADRIAANGDTANKIGTLGLAVSASYHNISFYVAAPYSTIDNTIASGKEIVIEERNSEEVKNFHGVRTAPVDSPAISPAFDVTPNQLITGIITEKQVLYPPYKL